MDRMIRILRRAFVYSIVIIFFSFGVLIAYSTGPIDGVTGSPADGGKTCNQSTCHTGNFPLNNSVYFSISGIPSNGYVPGTTYTITVAFSGLEGSTWGFEAMITDANNISSGTIVITNPIQTEKSGNYVKHRFSGTFSSSWSFEWIAPSTDVGVITIYAAGNQADGDERRSEDIIHTNSLARRADFITAVEDGMSVPHQFAINPNYPNPFNPVTTITYELDRTVVVSLKIYDVLGREVRTLVNTQQATGIHTVVWDGKNNAGIPVTSGTYISRLQSETSIVSRRLTLIK